MSQEKDIRIPVNNWVEREELQNTLVEIISILNKQEDTETMHRCIYWLSKILLFSEFPKEIENE